VSTNGLLNQKSDELNWTRSVLSLAGVEAAADFVQVVVVVEFDNNSRMKVRESNITNAFPEQVFRGFNKRHNVCLASVVYMISERKEIEYTFTSIYRSRWKV
jgi:hypothetical protein